MHRIPSHRIKAMHSFLHRRLRFYQRIHLSFAISLLPFAVSRLLFHVSQKKQEKTVSSLFELRGSLPKRTRIQIGLIGLAAIILVWWLVVTLKIFNPRIIPTPFAIV